MNNKSDENKSIIYSLELELYSFKKFLIDIKTKINNIFQSKGLYILYLYNYYKDVY